MFPQKTWLNSCAFDSFLLSQFSFSPFPLLFLLLSPLIYLNHPPGENRSPPQSGTDCFVRFMNPEPNPDKRTLVQNRCVICFCPRYLFLPERLCRYQSIYCAAVLQLWMQRGPGASQHIKAVTNREQGPNGKKCCGHK